MCGIVGYAGGKRAAEVVFEGLKNLEYRGYDSVGMATLRGGKISLEKKSGRVAALSDCVPYMCGNVGIGHTRWATHGKPDDINAHPHMAGKFCIVHNGIIENYEELKGELERADVKLISETDSEVVAQLLNFLYDGDLKGTIARTISRIRGTFALAILCEDFNGVIVAKRKSPAIIGYGDGNYVASDIPALPEDVKQITILEDGDIAFITGGDVEIYDNNLAPVKRNKIPAQNRASCVELGNYPHYMLKEIHEGGETIRQTADWFLSCDKSGLEKVLKSAGSIIIIGCGTAYNSGLIGAFYFEDCGIGCRVEVASEEVYGKLRATENCCVIAISQSGETADTLGAAERMKAAGAKVVAVTNSPYSALVRLADIVVPVRAGAEVCVAATKSYLGQIAALYCMSGIASNELERNICALQLTADRLEIVVESEGAQIVAEMCAAADGVFYLGRGMDYAVAVEGSLKLKEVSYIFSDAYPAGELKHGTLALVDDRTVSIMVACDYSLASKAVSCAREITSRGGKVVVVTTCCAVAEKLRDVVDYVYILPEVPPHLSCIACAVALQLIAYRTAVLLSRNPDKPRNLAKSVTVE